MGREEGTGLGGAVAGQFVQLTIFFFGSMVGPVAILGELGPNGTRPGV